MNPLHHTSVGTRLLSADKQIIQYTYSLSLFQNIFLSRKADCLFWKTANSSTNCYRGRSEELSQRGGLPKGDILLNSHGLLILGAKYTSKGLTTLDQAMGENPWLVAPAPIRPIAAGGFLAVSYLKNRESTGDVDCLINLEFATVNDIQNALKGTIRSLARDLRYIDDWINEATAIFVTTKRAEKSPELILRSAPLTSACPRARIARVLDSKSSLGMETWSKWREIDTARQLGDQLRRKDQDRITELKEVIKGISLEFQRGIIHSSSKVLKPSQISPRHVNNPILTEGTPILRHVLLSRP
jgi:hypothetical protein